MSVKTFFVIGGGWGRPWRRKWDAASARGEGPQKVSVVSVQGRTRRGTRRAMIVRV